MKALQALVLTVVGFVAISAVLIGGLQWATSRPKEVQPVAVVGSPAPAQVPGAVPSWTVGGILLELVVAVVLIPLGVVYVFSGGAFRYGHATSRHVSVDGRTLGWTHSRVPIGYNNAPAGNMSNGMFFFLWACLIVLYYLAAYAFMGGHPLTHWWTPIVRQVAALL